MEKSANIELKILEVIIEILDLNSELFKWIVKIETNSRSAIELEYKVYEWMNRVSFDYQIQLLGYLKDLKQNIIQVESTKKSQSQG